MAGNEINRADAAGPDGGEDALALLRDSEERFRVMAEAIDDVFYMTDLEAGRLLYVSPAYERVWGRSSAPLLEDIHSFRDALHPDDLPHYEANQATQLRGEPLTTEYRIVRPDGSTRLIYDRSFPVPGAEGRRSAGIASDITESRAGKRRQEMLTAELQHRVRNVLSIVRSFIRRTADSHDNVEDVVAHLDGRLSALARTQTLLTRDPGVGVDLLGMVLDELAAQAAVDQVSCSGPDVTLAPKAAEVLTLALHELATNAIKYGAFSVPGGSVRIRWTVDEAQDPPWLLFTWTERGGPPPEELEREGFGTELITRRVPYELGGEGNLLFEDGAVTARIAFPLAYAPSLYETAHPERLAKAGAAR